MDDIGLFLGDIGLFCCRHARSRCVRRSLFEGNVGLRKGDVGLFLGDVGLFLGDIGLFWVI